MSLRFRRSRNLGGGLRLNLSKTGIGLSAGRRGARWSVHSSGRSTRTVGIPGTGVFWRKDTHARSGRRSGRPAQRSGAVTATPAAARRPGWLAPKFERQLHRAYTAGEAMSEAALDAGPPAYRQAGWLLMAVAAMDRDPDAARRYLEKATAEPLTIESDRFLRRYFADRPVAVSTSLGLDVVLPPGRDLALVLLAHLAHERGDDDEAVAQAAKLSGSLDLAVVVVATLVRAGHHHEVLAATDGIENVDDPTMALCMLRGVALRELGHHTASREALRESLRFRRDRTPTLRHLALLERARTHLAEGQRARARRDLERIIAEDATFGGASELLAGLDGD